MESSSFQQDVERSGYIKMADSKRSDGRKKVLVVGAGAAG